MFGKKKKMPETTGGNTSGKPQTYTVFDTRTGKTFATKAEAEAYEKDFRKKTGIFVSVESTHRKVTHTYGLTPTK